MAEGYSPGTREIVAAIVEIWKKDPDSEALSYAKLLARVKAEKADAQWVLSEKRMKAALKEFNLQPRRELFTFVRETESAPVPHARFPPGVRMQQTRGRGKALFAAKPFRRGERLWDEPPLVHAARVELLRLMRMGRCCAYCAEILRTGPDGALLPHAGVQCINCTANWCSNACKRADIVHADTYHPTQRTFRPHVAGPRWKVFEQFCLEEDWEAGYMYGMALLYRLKLGAQSPYAKAMAGMARVRQDFRQRAVSDPASLEFEQHEQMWRRAYDLLAAAVRPVYRLEYDEFIAGIGMVNINNLHGSIFEVHSNLNHNCEPNLKVTVKPRAEGIEVVAAADIQPGQELTTTYVDPSLGVDDRQAMLRINWGFVCGCARCKRELDLKINPPKPPKSVLKPSSPPDSPVAPADGLGRRKSVRFEKNPVSLEVSS